MNSVAGHRKTIRMDTAGKFMEPGTLIQDTVKHMPSLSLEVLMYIMSAYLFGVVLFGLRVVKNLHPKGLVRGRAVVAFRALVALYDWVQIVINSLILLVVILEPELIRFAWRNLGQVHTTVVNEHHRVLISLGIIWYWLKVLDLVDTALFIARGKYNHVSFLQVYHHASMVVMVWISIHYAPITQNLFYAALNSCVHVVMYTYYMFSALGRPLGFKRTITRLQMSQFIIMTMFTAWLLMFVHTERVAIIYTLMLGVQALLFMCLFVNFYVREYVSGRWKRKRPTNRDIKIE